MNFPFMTSSELIFPAVGIFLGFFVQTVLGFAAGIVSVPLILQAVDIKTAIALISIYLFFFSVIQVPRNWKDIDHKIFKIFVIPIAIGVALGILALKFGKPEILQKALGVCILVYVIHSYLFKKPAKWVSNYPIAFGFTGGFFAGLFTTGGPVLIAYLSAKYNDTKTLRATIIGSLAVPNIVRICVLFLAGLLTPEVIALAITLSPCFIFALFLGDKTFKNLRDGMFRHIVMAFLTFSGLMLLLRQ